jgi:hypothetical protein
MNAVDIEHGAKIMNLQRRTLLVIAATFLLLSGCSRNSDSGNSSGSSSGSGTNWDSMVWDQGNWS